MSQSSTEKHQIDLQGSLLNAYICHPRRVIMKPHQPCWCFNIEQGWCQLLGVYFDAWGGTMEDNEMDIIASERKQKELGPTGLQFFWNKWRKHREQQTKLSQRLEITSWVNSCREVISPPQNPWWSRPVPVSTFSIMVFGKLFHFSQRKMQLFLSIFMDFSSCPREYTG